MTARIPATLIPGDGIGPEIVDATLAVLDALGSPFDWERQIAGLGGIQATGRKKVTIVHKANIMKALTGIFLEAGQQLWEEKYKGRIALDSVIIDACAMKLVLNPWQFDVLVTTNLFGDILSDLAAGLVGG